MDKTQPLDDYWIEVPDLTIYDAAFWMQIGGDPRRHEERCADDALYDLTFSRHPGGDVAVWKRTDSLYSAIQNNLIKVKKKVLGKNGELDFKSTRILKSDWLKWCRANGNPKTAELADWFEGKYQPQNMAECESPAERRERIERRCNEVMASGKRNFLEVVADEENTSVSNIKKLRNAAKKNRLKGAPAGTIEALKTL